MKYYNVVASVDIMEVVEIEDDENIDDEIDRIILDRVDIWREEVDEKELFGEE